MEQVKNSFNKKRLESFVDAILAIIVTILVLEFRVPVIQNATTQDLRHELILLLPHFFSYLISFLTIAALWLDHHNMFENISYTDRNFAKLNLLFLLFLSPLPFTTAFAGEYYKNSFAVAVVATNYFIMNMGFSFLYGYALNKKLLPASFFEFKRNKTLTIISISGMILLLASIPLAYINTYISFTIFIVVVIVHLFKDYK